MIADALALLGVPGVVLVLAWICFVGYWAARPFRPYASWHRDLAGVCERCRRVGSGQRRRRRLAHDLWPRAEVGPRMWRWPLNSTRHVSALLWPVVARPRGLLGLVARVSWHVATALGVAVALVQAVTLVVVVSVPVALVVFVVDSSTVIRGGTPPMRRRLARRHAALVDRETREAAARFAAIRANHTDISTGSRAA